MKNNSATRPFQLVLPLLLAFKVCLAQNVPCSSIVWELKNDCGSIQASGGCGPGVDPIFCVNQLVTVLNYSGPVSEITNTYIDWGDGNCQKFTGCPGSLTHVYDFPEDTCIQDGSGQLDLEVRLGVEKICGNQSSFNFIVFPIIVRFKPVALYSFNPPIPCVGSPVVPDNQTCPNADAAAYQWFVNGVLVSPDPEPDLTFPQSDTFSVRLEVTNSCGTDVFTREVVTLDPPIADLQILSGVIHPGNVICIGGGGGEVVLSGLNSQFETTYQWSISPTFGVLWLTDKDTSVVSLDFNSAGTYTVKLKVNNPCNGPDEMSVTFEAVLGEALSVIQQPDGCAPFTYSPAPFSANASYTLNGNPVTFPITLAEGEYALAATLTNICGEQFVTDTFVIKTPEPVSITSPSGPDTLCAGSAPLSLNADQPNVVWLGQNITTGAGGQQFFNPAGPGNFLLEAVYQMGTSCERRDTVHLVVQGVSATAGDIEICPGTASVPLNGAPAGGVWTCLVCPGCVQGDQFLPANYPGAYPVTLHYTVSEGECSASTDITLNVAVPDAVFSIETPVCAGANIAVNTAGANGNNFLWRMDGQMLAAGPPFTGLPAGAHTLEMVAIINACRDSLLQTFTVVAPPAGAAFTADVTEGCSPLAVVFTPADSALPGLTYAWQFSGGAPADANTWAAPDTVFFVNNSKEPAWFTVTYAVENACGKKEESATVQVNVAPTAELGIDSTDSGCSPFGVIITNRTLGLPDSCMLSFSDGFSLVECFDSLLHTFYANTQTTAYSLHLWTQNECGVSDWTDTVTVIPPGVEAFFELDDYSVCPGTALEFKDASTPFPAEVHWNFGDGSFSGDPIATHIFTTPNDTLSVVLRVSTGCGYDTIRRTVVTFPLPGVAFELPPVACAGSPLSIENLSDPDLFGVRWDYGDGAADSTRFDGSHTYTEAGEQLVRLTVTDWNRCTASLEKELEVRPRPVVGFYTDPAAGCAPLSVAFHDTSQHVNQWRWIFEDGTELREQHTGKVFDVGQYSVKLVASWEGVCADSVTQYHVVRADACNVFIPNVFAPASGGGNSIFTVFAGPELERIDVLRVFDYWGELVYEGKDLSPDRISGWDGTHQGKALPPGVFIYYTELRFEGNTVEKFEGDVTLLR